MRQRQLRHDARDLRALGAVRLQELPPRRQVVEDVVDLDARAFGRADFGDRRDRAAVDADLGPALLSPRARPQHEMRHRRDRRQRLSSKPHRRDRGEIVGAADLARRMTLDRQARVLRLHPLAIVVDAHLLLAAELDVNRDARGAGVDGVLDELLDDRGGTFDDFAGGDLIGEVGGQPVDLAHARSSGGRRKRGAARPASRCSSAAARRRRGGSAGCRRRESGTTSPALIGRHCSLRQAVERLRPAARAAASTRTRRAGRRGSRRLGRRSAFTRSCFSRCPPHGRQLSVHRPLTPAVWPRTSRWNIATGPSSNALPPWLTLSIRSSTAFDSAQWTLTMIVGADEEATSASAPADGGEQVPVIGFDLRRLRRRTASSTARRWKANVSVRTSDSGMDGAARSTQM